MYITSLTLKTSLLPYQSGCLSQQPKKGALTYTPYFHLTHPTLPHPPLQKDRCVPAPLLDKTHSDRGHAGQICNTRCSFLHSCSSALSGPTHTHTTRAQLAVITDERNKGRWLCRLPVRNSNGPARATSPNGPARARNRPPPPSLPPNPLRRCGL